MSKGHCYLVAKLYLTRLQPHELHSLPGSSVQWDFLGKNTGVGCHLLLQGIFLMQLLNLFFCIGRQILYYWAAWEAHGNSYVNLNHICTLTHTNIFKLPFREVLPINNLTSNVWDCWFPPTLNNIGCYEVFIFPNKSF